MTRYDCPVGDCPSRLASGECKHMKTEVSLHPQRCAYGTLAVVVEKKLKNLGDWKIRQFNDYVRATLNGKAGRVEVRLGDAYCNEVLFLPKGRGREPIVVTSNWYAWDSQQTGNLDRRRPDDEMPVREAVLKACEMAQVPSAQMMLGDL